LTSQVAERYAIASKKAQKVRVQPEARDVSEPAPRERLELRRKVEPIIAGLKERIESRLYQSAVAANAKVASGLSQWLPGVEATSNLNRMNLGTC
jgi:hypothetical protein